MLKGVGKRFSLIQGRGHDGSIRKVPKEDSRSSTYRVYDDVTYAKKKRELKCHVSPAVYLLMHDFNTHDCSLSAFYIVPIDCLFFRRLKINHDSHEFIFKFGTIANITVLYVQEKKKQI
jgi:hypothetical protein